MCHPGKIEEITKFVQDTENVISMQKQYKKESRAAFKRAKSSKKRRKNAENTDTGA